MTQPYRLTCDYATDHERRRTVAEFASRDDALLALAAECDHGWDSLTLRPLTEDAVPLVSRTGKRVLAVGRMAPRREEHP